MRSPITLHSIGSVCSSRKEVIDDNWDQETTYIELDGDSFSAESLAGLSEFSHAEILFFMNKVDPNKVDKTARHPRNNTEWPKVGIFAQRGKNRPNRIGLTICRVLKIEGLKVHLQGLDAVDGTPVLDIKPWVQESLRVVKFISPRGLQNS